MPAMSGIRTRQLLVAISLLATGCGGDDDDDGGGGGGDGADGGSANVTELPGLVPDDVAVAIPDSVQESQHRLGGDCFLTGIGEDTVNFVRDVEQAHGEALAQVRFIDLMAGAVSDSTDDATYSEAGAFTIEVSEELAALVAADIADYPALRSPPAGTVFPSPRFCYLRNQPDDFSHAFYLDRHDFAVGAGCDDLDEYKTRFEWNDDRTRFRIRTTFYRDFWPSPDFDGEPEPPPENADDDVIGYVTYTFDSTTAREWYRTVMFQDSPRPEFPADTDVLYELTGTLEECGADECLRLQLANNNIGEVFDRVTIIAGQADIAGAVLVGTQSQRDGILGGVLFSDDQTILDGLGCARFHRPREADGYPAWTGEGDPTAAPFYQEVIVDGIDFNSAAIDFSGLAGLPDSDDDLPRLFVIARGGADPASDPSAAIGVGFAHNFFGDQLFTPYVYWGTPAEVADADVYEDDWDSEAHAPTYAPIAGTLAIAP